MFRCFPNPNRSVDQDLDMTIADARSMGLRETSGDGMWKFTYSGKSHPSGSGSLKSRVPAALDA